MKNENLNAKSAQKLYLFRQSLRISPKRATCDIIIIFLEMLRSLKYMDNTIRIERRN